MKMTRVLMSLAIVATLAAPALAGNVAVPLPGPGTMSVNAHSAFSEIFLTIEDGFAADLRQAWGLPAAGDLVLNNVAIGGYDFNTTTGGGTPITLRNYALYTGSSTSVGGPAIGPGSTILAVNPNVDAATAGLPVPELDIAGLLSGDVDGVRGRLYVGGIINTIEGSGGDTVTYNNGGPGDNNPNPQMTFSIYNAYIDDVTLSASGSPNLATEFQLSPADGEELHLDIWADSTPDATVQGVPTGGKRYASAPSVPDVQPEIPVRDDVTGALLVDLDTGTYYDSTGTWGDLAFAGDPGDDDNVFWSFVGNPESFFEVTESFQLGGESFAVAFDINNDGVVDADDVVLTAGSSNVTNPSGLFLNGQFIPGDSLIPVGYTNAAGFVVNDPDLDGSGAGYGNALLDANGHYFLKANFEFGGQTTGAYDSDPDTFTFQQGEPGSVGTLTQLTGPLGFIPEPMTMFALLMGSGGLVGYLRRRRNA